MLTEDELSELLEIRKQIDTLQARYDQLAAAMAAAPAPVVPKSQPRPEPVQQQVPVQTPAAATTIAPAPGVPRTGLSKAAPAKNPHTGALLRAGVKKAMASPIGHQQVRPGGLHAARLGAAKAGISGRPTPAPLIQSPGISTGDMKPETKKIALPGAFAAARAAADAAARAAAAAASSRGAPARPLAVPAPGARPALTLKDCIRNVVAQAGKSISFEEVYKRLEASKAPLPTDKPKLVVRQILYNKAVYKSDGRGFLLAEPGLPGPVVKKGNQPTIAAPVDKDKLFKSRLDALLKKM